MLMRRTIGTRRTDAAVIGGETMAARPSVAIAGPKHACYALPIRSTVLCAAFAVIAAFAPQPALAASLDGAAMTWPWALPFLAMLLSIATGPLLLPKFWHHHYGKI